MSNTRLRLHRQFRDSRGDWRQIAIDANKALGGQREQLLRRAVEGYSRGLINRLVRLAAVLTLGLVAGLLFINLGYNALSIGLSVIAAIGVHVFVSIATWIMICRGESRPIDGIGLWLSQSRLCMSCGYDLVEVRPESDGCTVCPVCPECGAAYHYPTLAHASREGVFLKGDLMVGVDEGPKKRGF